MTQYLYLHGFASSPASKKAQYFGDRCLELDRPLLIPDLNQGDFSHLTITRQLEQIAPYLNQATVIIGSSLGGYTAALLGEIYPEFVTKLVLLAPAFEFINYWRDRLGSEQLQTWKNGQYLPVYHYSQQQKIPLHYNFFADAEIHSDRQLKQPIPTLILHGIHDEIVPLEASQNYQKSRDWVTLKPIESDHSLNDCLDLLWTESCNFLGL